MITFIIYLRAPPALFWKRSRLNLAALF